MADLYIATKTQADYDALIRLAEAAGYTWEGGRKPSELKLYQGENTVVHLDLDSKNMWQALAKYYNDVDCTIETIPNLADIKAIYRFENEESFNLFHETHDKHLSATSHKNPFAIEYSDGSVLFDYKSIYDALAVEYKPQESEVMPEKVKLPRNIINSFSEELESSKFKGLGARTPIAIITRIDSTLGGATNEVRAWCNNSNNQHKLIRAVLYGYEPEPEQLYYVQLIKNHDYYLNLSTTSGNVFLNTREQGGGFQTKFTMPEIIAIDPRYKAFAVPVEEVDGYEHE